jgi:hypothetical protein
MGETKFTTEKRNKGQVYNVRLTLPLV